MIRCKYRIRLINGEVVHISECVETEEERLITQFKKLSENDVLKVGCGSSLHAYIPVRNIMLIDSTPAFKDYE